MSIQGDVNELNNINAEIQRLNGRLRKLRARKKDLENNIVTFLKEKDQPGVKYQGVAIMLESKEKRGRKKEKDRVEDTLHVLRKHGVHHAEDVLEDLMEARKGDKVQTDTLKLQKIKK